MARGVRALRSARRLYSTILFLPPADSYKIVRDADATHTAFDADPAPILPVAASRLVATPAWTLQSANVTTQFRE